MRNKRFKGFTLIELLIVVAIIALLISILLPSLNGARRQSRTVKCGANLNQVGVSMATYLTENRSVFPSSYVYPYDSNGSVDICNQGSEPKYGYKHWSWFLYGRGTVSDSAFTCPEINKGGHPRTNPGKDPNDWEPNQVDQNGKSGGDSGNFTTDWQARRMAFTANAAVIPRNKFECDPDMRNSGIQRFNKCVNETQIQNPGRVILATEFYKNFNVISVGSGPYKSKSHRSINPFFHGESGANEYQARPDNPTFFVGDPTASPKEWLGILPENSLSAVQIFSEESGGSPYPLQNAVGRHHPGGKKLGGTANFLYVGGGVQKKTVLKTMWNKEWGDKYYGLTGESAIDPYNQFKEVYDSGD